MLTRRASQRLSKKNTIKEEILENNQEVQEEEQAEQAVDEQYEEEQAISESNNNEIDDSEEPESTIIRHFTRGTNSFKIEYKFLKIVKSDEELNLLRFEKGCNNENMRRYKNFRHITLNCYSRYNTKINCPYGLFAQRRYGGIYVYENGEHNHEMSKITKRLARSENLVKIPDINPPEVVKTITNEWIFISTVNGMVELDKIRVKNRCQNFRSYHLDSESKSIILKCNMAAYKSVNCLFRLMAKGTNDGEQFHVYKHGEHTCPKSYSMDKIQRHLVKALRLKQSNRLHNWMKHCGNKRIHLIVNVLDSNQIKQMIILANKEMKEGNKGDIKRWMPWLQNIFKLRDITEND